MGKCRAFWWNVFYLFGPDGIAFYWQDVRNEERVLSRRKNGVGVVMVWGALTENCVSDLSILGGNQDSKRYVDILSNYLLPFAAKEFNSGWAFRQDNATINKSKLIKKWFPEHSLAVMDWAARSPDLDPIENISGILVRCVYADERQFATIRASPELETIAKIVISRQ